MKEDILSKGPVAFLAEELGLHISERLLAYQSWWEAEGLPISMTIDRAGTPHLRQFSHTGERIDQILYPSSYAYLLDAGYSAGILYEVAEKHNWQLSFMLGFITSYYDPGLYCPYTVTFSSWAAIYKYYHGPRREEFLNTLSRKEPPFGQGGTWMTEIHGGSDLGSNVQTIARSAGEIWLLTGDKYFASNVGADLAVVAARIEGAPASVKGLSLFIVPQDRSRGGGRNYLIRRLKDKIGTRSVPTGEVELRDSEGYLVGEARQGIYYIMEVLNFSRVANSIGVVAHGVHALAQAYRFAQQRRVFGRFLVEQPLFRHELHQHYMQLKWAGALAWLTEQWLEAVWLEKPPYSERYLTFRLLTHLAKFWTAKVALHAAQWNLEVWAGLGTLAEFPPERLVRELIVTDIWEGTRHRHLLDAWEVLKRYNLLPHLQKLWDISAIDKTLFAEIEQALAHPEEEMIQSIEPLLTRLARAIGQITAKERAYKVLP
ncbi:MAG: acyl-CoA dehydrogenase family protein [Bacteroidia bacterium]|nr:acyl-CoA dehydrogenase family protein [Bacteroidia bacterium]MCX7652588.1 acyl-CoA dehydrogenase family protein [Bacteroidia bacterium]MDW8417178.1 acyl-CoA dehydrogenase family protein [Bacteroidia bacterium]